MIIIDFNFQGIYVTEITENSRIIGRQSHGIAICWWSLCWKYQTNVILMFNSEKWKCYKFNHKRTSILSLFVTKISNMFLPLVPFTWLIGTSLDCYRFILQLWKLSSNLSFFKEVITKTWPLISELVNKIEILWIIYA